MFVVDGANAARDIVLLSGNSDKVVIDDAAGTIFITDGDPTTFVFECFDDVTGEPADIDAIGLSGTPSGTVTVSIVPGPHHTFGAKDVRLLDLVQDGVSSTVEEFKIEADLGADGETYVDQIVGTFDVGKFVRTDVYIQTLAGHSSFLALELEASLYVTGPGPHAGLIDIEHFGDSTKTIHHRHDKRRFGAKRGLESTRDHVE